MAGMPGMDMGNMQKSCRRRRRRKNRRSVLSLETQPAKSKARRKCHSTENSRRKGTSGTGRHSELAAVMNMPGMAPGKSNAKAHKGRNLRGHS